MNNTLLHKEKFKHLKNEHATYNLPKAIIFACGATLSVSLMSFFVKLTNSNIGESTQLFFRFAISFIYILVFLGIRKLQGKKTAIKPRQISLHFVRAVSSFLAIFTLFITVRHISLVDAYLLGASNQIFVALFTMLIYKTKYNSKIWLGIACAFFGVTSILKPDMQIFNYSALCGLASGMFTAVSLLSGQQLNKENKIHAIIFNYFLLTFIFSVIIVVFHWQTPNTHELLLLIAIGIFGTMYQDFIMRSLTYAAAYTISPLLYLSVVHSVFLGWIFLGDIPDIFSLIGAVLICGGNIYIIKLSAKASQ